MRVAIYLRVSTDSQTTGNQRLELEAVAAHSGWDVVQVYEDSAISGAKGRERRPAYDNLLNAAARREFDLVAAWSVDRLGRSLQELVAFLNELQTLKIDLYLHQQGMDTTTPAGKAMFQMCGVFAEFEREMISERVKAGLERARAEGKTLGRPRVGAEIEAAIVAERASGKGKRRIASELGVGVGTVQRVLGAANT